MGWAGLSWDVTRELEGRGWVACASAVSMLFLPVVLCALSKWALNTVFQKNPEVMFSQLNRNENHGLFVISPSSVDVEANKLSHNNPQLRSVIFSVAPLHPFLCSLPIVCFPLLWGCIRSVWQWTDGVGTRITNGPDESNYNLVTGNDITPRGNECVDVKEGASFNVIEHNQCAEQLDDESGCYDSRGNENTFRYNMP